MEATTKGCAGIDLTTSTGHLIRRAGQRYSAIWANLIPRGLTSPQFGVLAILDSAGPLDQQTIGERGGLDKSTCGDLIDRMQRAGLVNSDVDPKNRRRKAISLTAAGRKRLREAIPFQRQVHEQALAGLTSDDRVELNRLLRKMLNLPSVDEAAQ